jgi:hypothetical protein
MKPISAEEQRTSLEFSNELNWVLQFCPTHPSEKALMARFAKLGIGAGKKFVSGDPQGSRGRQGRRLGGHGPARETDFGRRSHQRRCPRDARLP